MEQVQDQGQGRDQQLHPKHAKGITDRGLDLNLAMRMGLYSGTPSRDFSTVVREPNGRMLCFPFFENGEEVNTKLRWSSDGQRRFAQRRGATKTPFNIDCVLGGKHTAALKEGVKKLVWTEGEFDCIAAVQCGFEVAVSLPDGAVAARDASGKPLPPVPEDARDIDPENDDKFKFFARHADELMMVKFHIIATDADEPGQRMAKELVRRIGQARCLMVTYPTEQVVPDTKADMLPDGTRPSRACKDLNEVLLHLGEERVRQILEEAKPWPVRGLYKLSDYPDQEDPVTYETGICDALDEAIRLYESAFMVVTGIPGAGKSTLVNQMTVEMARCHRWHTCMFSGEAQVKPYLANPLMTAFLRKPKQDWTYEEKMIATDFVERYYSFIDYSVRPDEEETELDVDFVIAKAADSCLRFGTRLLVVDPWNELEHGYRPGNVNQSEHVGQSIRKFKRFAKDFGCAVIIVAHPTKMDPGQVPSLYSISDSANFANKAELSMIVHAPDILLPEREIIVPKVKFKGTGTKGNFPIGFDMRTHLFGPAKPSGMVF
jgi:twinkle protein